MSQLVTYVRAYVRHRIADERGASAIEYGLVAALIALVITIGLVAVSGGLNDLFGTVGTELEDAQPAG